MWPLRVCIRSVCWLLLACSVGGTFNSRIRCISESFAWSWDFFLPIGLPCFLQYEGFFLSYCILFFLLCLVLETCSFLKKEQWIWGKGKLGGGTRRSRGNESRGWNVLEKNLFSTLVKIATKVRAVYRIELWSDTKCRIWIQTRRVWEIEEDNELLNVDTGAEQREELLQLPEVQERKEPSPRSSLWCTRSSQCLNVRSPLWERKTVSHLSVLSLLLRKCNIWYTIIHNVAYPFCAT